jgi:hypothetical protein
MPKLWALDALPSSFSERQQFTLQKVWNAHFFIGAVDSMCAVFTFF